ncbi:TetR/AcrR family transcriptional regulator [Mycobacterium sp. pV006]|uniref:TetR/AcrR family transcriptional regulator n=1 Tax=Mycobacterium sp. pV006 TaxID=3238983 RepID=UPI00351B458D
MRQVKKADVRRGEIVTAALKLFAERGYEKTTVEAIIGELGVAKGCFYHHFRSKDDVFAASAQVMAERLLTDIRRLLTDTAMRPAERLVAFLDYTYRLAEDQNEFLRMPQPATVADLDHRVSNLVASQLQPTMTELIESGTSVGDFDVDDADLTAAAVLGALNNIHNVSVGRADLDLVSHRRSVLDLLGRLLGTRLPEGGAT